MNQAAMVLTRAQALDLVRHCGHWRPGDPAYAWACTCCQHTADAPEKIQHTKKCPFGVLKAQLGQE